MAKLEKLPMMGRDRFFGKIRAVPDHAYDRTDCFDSELYIPPYATESWKLTITIRIFYRQINPNQILGPVLAQIAKSNGLPTPVGNVGFYPDADDKPKWIKDWTLTEWSNFLQSVKVQAALWNNKFWLIPSRSFDLFDRDIAERSDLTRKAVYRPTIECLFNFEIAPLTNLAHTSVDVVNIYGPDFFRSHSKLYNTNDAAIRPVQKSDWRGRLVKTNHPVIAHEIGHSLGLPHIGQSRNLQHCSLAINWEKFVHQDGLPWIYKGGSNADVCYGTSSTQGDIDNIMGAGGVFSTENGKPWLDRFFNHLNLSFPELFRARGNWTVSMSNTPPMKIV